MVTPGILVSCVLALASPQADSTPGLAAKYPGDVGIKKDPAFIFGDDFEGWPADGATPPKGTWHGIRKGNKSRTRVVAGRVTVGGKNTSGGRVLETACWHAGGSSSTAGVHVKLGNYNHANERLGDGYENIHVRYYMKLAEDYKPVRNHGANLGGRDVTVSGSRWVGMSNIRDVSSKGYFYCGVQPYGGRKSEPLHMNFYSYHMDKPGPWGDKYDVQKMIPLQPGRWTCVERRMKLNSADPLKADGLEELWIDGVLTIRREKLRFRKVPQLRITLFSLENYYHGLPAEFTPERPLRVYYDNVVIARKYIGPVRLRKP